MAEIAYQKKHIINYYKTRDVYMAYRKVGYFRKFYKEHSINLLLYKAAKVAFNSLENEKFPTVKSMQMEYSQLLSEKKKAHAKYYSAKKKCRMD